MAPIQYLKTTFYNNTSYGSTYSDEVSVKQYKLLFVIVTKLMPSENVTLNFPVRTSFFVLSSNKKLRGL